MMGHRSFLVLALGGVLAGSVQAAGKVDFTRDIRPILSNHCFVCHGPDNNLRKGRLRLDVSRDAGKVHGGLSVVVPGKPAESELLTRVLSDDPQRRMPPPKAKKDLTPAQVELLRQWIAEGANFEELWSLVPPKKAPLPAVKQADRVRNPIDAFLQARLEKEGLKPVPPADRRTLLRRLYFDLTGLPPEPAEVEAFLKDTAPDAYEKLVERLLLSPHHGERMAQWWLDLVRFADTGGYHSDNHRDLWLYRDWVIEAFARNLPFDRFTTEQLAGDLLPEATWPQRIASGYNRLLQTTEEGGAQAKEYQAKYYADRVRNVSSVWLGMTLGCCECHDHKYDPFTTKEFYQFASFFADIQERSVGRQQQTPVLDEKVRKQIDEIDVRIAPLKKAVDARTPELDQAQAKWEAEIRAAGFKGVPKNIVAVLNLSAEKRNPQQANALAKHFRDITPLLAKPRQELASLEKRKSDLMKAVPTTLISMAGTPRSLRVLPRGNWLDDSGEVVQPEVPDVLPDLPLQGKRATRLDLARWLLAPDNPLTSRVFVNRLWALFYGQGIVKTQDDLGNQGTLPTHPELLDWLALEFRTKGWNVRDMVRLMVLSDTYRQSSSCDAALRKRDPYNQLYARQARFRLDAEFVRDNALAVSGLLVRKIGGPSVKPYQPEGYWAFLNFPTRTWQADKGENQYRRGMYTYWQRTFLHPSLLAFDAPTREECTVERPRSNTPQQALVLLNDPTYVEASRALAERILQEGGTDTRSRLEFAFRRVLNRSVRPEEVAILNGMLDKQVAHYSAQPKEAVAFLQVGQRPVPKDLPAPVLAAWTNVARTVLNLHETITRE